MLGESIENILLNVKNDMYRNVVDKEFINELRSGMFVVNREISLFEV